MCDLHCVRAFKGSEDLAIAKCKRSRTQRFSNDSPAPVRVLIKVVHRIGMGLGWASRFSRKTLSRSDCSFELGGTAKAAERACNGSNGAFVVISWTKVCHAVAVHASEQVKASISKAWPCFKPSAAWATVTSLTFSAMVRKILSWKEIY